MYLKVIYITLSSNQACHGYGYIHVWISDLSHPVDISMDIMLAHLLIKLTLICFVCLEYFPVCCFYSLFSRLFYVI